jgi:hypothetical protein
MTENRVLARRIEPKDSGGNTGHRSRGATLSSGGFLTPKAVFPRVLGIVAISSWYRYQVANCALPNPGILRANESILTSFGIIIAETKMATTGPPS